MKPYPAFLLLPLACSANSNLSPTWIEKLPSEISLTWVDERTLEMVLPDNSTYKIPLVQTNNIPGLVTPCLFSGKIDGDPESLVSVSGCKDNEDEVLIASKKFLGGLSEGEGGGLELILSNGRTYKVPEDNTRGRDDDGIDLGPDPNVARRRGRFNGRLPQSVILETHLRYDNSLLAEFGNNPTKVKRWLASVVELAKPKMLLIDLKVELRIVGTMKRYNRNIASTDAWITRIRRNENKGLRGPISYFSADTSPRGNGIAYVGSACSLDGRQINIVERRQTPLATARTFVHELGHNIGMLHDFDVKHGGNNKAGSNIRGCEGEGLMSYGSKRRPTWLSRRPTAWSTCSNGDFENWYRSEGHTCLKDGAPTTTKKYEVVGHSDNCASGGEVTTERECKKAALDLGLDFRQAGSWPRAQRYCLVHNNQIWFNRDTRTPPSSTTRFRALCMKKPESKKYEVVGYRDGCGRGEVTTEKECKKAATELGLSFRRGGRWGKHQGYCLVDGKNQVWFNKDTRKAPSSDTRNRALCVGNPAKLREAFECGAETTWPDLDNTDSVCGECKVLVDKMDTKYSTCASYCSSIGRRCTGAWEEKRDSCTVERTEDCRHNFGAYTSDAICECGQKADVP